MTYNEYHYIVVINCSVIIDETSLTIVGSTRALAMAGPRFRSLEVVFFGVLVDARLFMAVFEKSEDVALESRSRSSCNGSDIDCDNG